jgi:hypothetical protein
MRRYPLFLFLVVPLFTVLLSLSSGCGGEKPAPPQESRPEPRQPEYNPTATIKDLMLALIDPSADVVWGAVQTVVTLKGTENKFPRNDEEWTEVRRGALRLSEATNLLMMPGRRVARPGEKSEAPGIELEPEQMDELLAKDREGWNRRAKQLHDATLEALRAIDAKDAPALMEIGERIEAACENCHTAYWYPNQKLPPGYEGRN